VFTGSDRIGHFLWDAYEDNDHTFHSKFLEYFHNVDDALGDIIHRMNENDSLIMLSDHGMERIDTNVNINTYLAQNEFLKLGNDIAKRYNNIEKGTKAFALDPARIYLNRQKKFPRGAVEKKEEEEVIDLLIELFSSLEKNGEKIVRKIYKKEEIYHGTYLENAPDLVLLPNPGFSLRGSMGKNELFEKDDIIAGMHTQQDAFLYVKTRNKDIVPRAPTVEDVIPILKKSNG
jgi:predicted AlkP superfamily phosphohydrolase/phosphomutase